MLIPPRLRARAIAAHLRLVRLPVPFALPPFDMRLCWHRQLDTGLRSQWLRAQLTAAVAELGLGRPARAAGHEPSELRDLAFLLPSMPRNGDPAPIRNPNWYQPPSRATS